MTAKKFAAALLGALVLLSGPAASMLSEVQAAPAQSEQKEKKPPRQKGGKAEVLTYERAMEIENNRHQRKLVEIRRFYKYHSPKRRLAIQKENEFHAKRVEEIKKRFGMG